MVLDTLKASKKNFHDLRPITQERANYLDNIVAQRAGKFKDANVIMGGGLSIPYLLRLYEKVLANHQEASAKGIREWFPSGINTVMNNYYRDHNGIFHLLCLQEDLPQITDQAAKYGLTLVHRKRDVTVFPGTKLEECVPVTPQRMIEIHKRSAKEWFTSNAVRFMNLNDKTGEDYYDVFIHHYVDDDGRDIKRTSDDTFVREFDNKVVEQSQVNVECYKDKGLKVRLEHFQPLIYKNQGVELNLANPFYMFHVKRRALEKKRALERDGADLDVLDKMLEFLQIKPLETILQGIRRG